MLLKTVGFLINFFLTTNSEKGNFNFLKKVQLTLTMQRNKKCMKFSSLTENFKTK